LEEGARPIFGRDGDPRDDSRRPGVQVQPVARFPRGARVQSLLVLWAILRAGSAWGQGFFEQSPGPLTAAHAALEGQGKCTECHTSGKNLANDKCLACHDHDNMRRRIASGRGFHVSPRVSGKQCWLCHGEHKGRAFDGMGFAKIGGIAAFDHAQTGWPLDGAHKRLKCETCHTTKNRVGQRLFLGNAETCAGCHRKVSPHGRMTAETEKCERCHGTEVWKPVLAKLTFDHNDPKQARYPVVGLHAEVACIKCHPGVAGATSAAKKGPVWKVKTPFGDCKQCHAKDEPATHRGHLFELKRCDACHSEKRKWKEFVFDHAKRTKFALTGKHAEIDCYTCHKARVTAKPERTCESAMCHARDNKHQERFKAFPSCATCHNTVRWKPDNVFAHNTLTKFKLTGKHAVATCRNCHRGETPNVFEKFAPRIQCMECHKHKDVHDHQFTSAQCANCHKPGVRNAGVKSELVDEVHGPKSRFPLDGGHVNVACVKCHPKEGPNANNVWKVSMQCGPACHPDKLHKGSLGNDCQRCHEGGYWKATDFDHDRDSKFPLVGFHKTTGCLNCHPNRLFKPTASECFSCHARDDAHASALGQQCEKCHEPTGRSLFDHNTKSNYPLTGKHTQVVCEACHPSIQFKPVPSDCYGCHEKDDVHKGTYGFLCEMCHSVKGWQQTAPVHDVGNFRLAGMHDHVPCERCHGPTMRPLAGTGEFCINCHRQDDIHHNALGPRCGECHNQWGFAPSTFLHSNVGCDLRAVHRVQPCESCHRGGNYTALSPTCVSCHRKDALAAAQRHMDMAHLSYTACATCHNANYWNPQTGVNGQQFESVCR
jgi:hypothetical protein